MNWTAEQLIAKYVEIRDDIADISERHKNELAPKKQALEIIENALMQILNDQGGQNIKTPAGTAYRSEVLTVKVESWPLVQEYITTHGRWDMLVQNVNKTAIKELLETTGTLPPGVSTQTIFNLNVRRA